MPARRKLKRKASGNGTGGKATSATVSRAIFDTEDFLTTAGAGRRICTYRTRSYIFRQGTKCDAIFYIQAGRVELSVMSKQGKEPAAAHTRCPGHLCLRPTSSKARLLIGNCSEPPVSRSKKNAAVATSPPNSSANCDSAWQRHRQRVIHSRQAYRSLWASQRLRSSPT